MCLGVATTVGVALGLDAKQNPTAHRTPRADRTPVRHNCREAEGGRRPDVGRERRIEFEIGPSPRYEKRVKRKNRV